MRADGHLQIAGLVAAGLLAVSVVLSASPQEAALEEHLAICASCHGANGVSTIANTPSLAGQPVLYTQTQLFLFREGQRVHDAMNAAARGMSDDRLTALAEHYAKLRPEPPPAVTSNPRRDTRGRELAATHRCGVCHLPDYAGRDQIPRLFGQREDYLRKALHDYKKGARAGDGAQMAEVVYRLNDDELDALAHHIAHLR